LALDVDRRSYRRLLQAAIARQADFNAMSQRTAARTCCRRACSRGVYAAYAYVALEAGLKQAFMASSDFDQALDA